MIRFCVNIGNAQKEIEDLIDDAMRFSDCRFGNPLFGKWKEDIRLFLLRTYDAKKSGDKWSKFSDIQFLSAEWSNYLSSIGTITPANSGLCEAVAILSAWREDLSKRKGAHQMNRIMTIIKILVGMLLAGGVITYGVLYFNQSNRHSSQNIINNGTIGNMSSGDNSMQTIEAK